MRFVTSQDAPAKTDHPSRSAVNGEYNPPVKTVIQAVLLFDGQAGFNQVFFFITLLNGMFREGIPFIGTKAELESTDYIFADGPFLEIGEANCLAPPPFRIKFSRNTAGQRGSGYRGSLFHSVPGAVPGFAPPLQLRYYISWQDISALPDRRNVHVP